MNLMPTLVCEDCNSLVQVLQNWNNEIHCLQMAPTANFPVNGAYDELAVEMEVSECVHDTCV